MAQAVAYKGLNRVAQVIVNDFSHGAVGSGAVAPTSDDTELGTETDRVATTKRIRYGNKFQQRIFFSNANLPSTVAEVGFFMDGSGTADSGEMLVRTTLAFVKGTQDLMLIFECEVEES
jgi:hypothetical protein